MQQTIIDWVHLLYLGTFLSIISFLQCIIVGFYHLFPFPSLLDRLFLTSKGLQGWFSFRLGKATEGTVEAKRQSADGLIQHTPYHLETHAVETKDGFILVLHRLVPKHSSSSKSNPSPSVASSSSTGTASRKQQHTSSSSNNADPAFTGNSNATTSSNNSSSTTNSGDGAGSTTNHNKRPPVLLMHALMQDSESFLCGGKHSLALFLANAGFDVWLGNNRGNRYSHKHIRLTPDQDEYWNYGIDELARYDVPALVGYILNSTAFPQLRYVGFSQGSAQAFAAFVLDPELASNIKLFIALAAPPRARGLSKSTLATLVESNPRFIYLLFGRHAILSSTLMWMKIMSPELFVWTVDRAIQFLFQWSAKEVSSHRKVKLYQHIFSYASVKTVVHWFQLIRLRRLVMYTDHNSPNRLPVEYDLTRLKLPVAVFYGGKDTVIDIDALMKELPYCIKLHKEDEYEHLDCIWADTALTRVFPLITQLLQTYS